MGFDSAKNGATPCPCGKSAVVVTGARIYPHRPDLAAKRFFLCECGRYVGAHAASGEPLGTPADAATRAARARAHAAFDPLWRQGHFPSRGAAYAWLARTLGASGAVHIADSDAARCDAIAVVAAGFLARPVRGASLLELLILIVGLGVAGLVACASIGAALSERDAARAHAAAEERRADEATAALARLNNRAHELAEHVRTHLALDDEQCCSCGGAE